MYLTLLLNKKFEMRLVAYEADYFFLLFSLLLKDTLLHFKVH